MFFKSENTANKIMHLFENAVLMTCKAKFPFDIESGGKVTFSRFNDENVRTLLSNRILQNIDYAQYSKLEEKDKTQIRHLIASGLFEAHIMSTFAKIRVTTSHKDNQAYIHFEYNLGFLAIDPGKVILDRKFRKAAQFIHFLSSPELEQKTDDASKIMAPNV